MVKSQFDLPPVDCSQGGFAYNGEHIEYWKARALKAESAAPAQTWQPIDTAPKGDDSILATDARILNFTQVVFWYPDNAEYPWATDDGIGYHEDRFTHWMPVPKAPSLSSTHRTGGE